MENTASRDTKKLHYKLLILGEDASQWKHNQLEGPSLFWVYSGGNIPHLAWEHLGMPQEGVARGNELLCFTHCHRDLDPHQKMDGKSEPGLNLKNTQPTLGQVLYKPPVLCFLCCYTTWPNGPGEDRNRWNPRHIADPMENKCTHDCPFGCIRE